MKIFVSYSRRDAGDFAKQINERLMDEHDIFTDINSIQLGDIWTNTIEKNISNCDIFVVIITHAALSSPEVEKEVFQAQKENKKIIPCIYGGIKKDKIKWGLEKFQGVEFTNEYQLARDLYSKININYNIPSDKIASDISEPTIKTPDKKKIVDTSPTKLDIDRVQQTSDLLPPRGNIGAIGGGKEIQSTSSTHKTIEPSKEEIYIEKNNIKQGQGIFGSISENVDDTNTITTTNTPIKSHVDKIQQKKETIGAIGGIGVQSTSPKDSLVESNNTERKYNEKDSSRQSPGINLKIIIIPIITIAVIGLIVSLIYFNGLPSPPDTIERVPTTQPNTTKTVLTPQSDTSQEFFGKSWGSQGTGDGQFNGPEGISVDSSKAEVYVTDSNNHRIQKFDINGNFITQWDGNGTGQFNYPKSISVDSSTGEVYLVELNNNRIQKFDSNGTFITMWGSQGTGDGQFDYTEGISVDSSTGEVYVTDLANNRIQKFDSNGNFITKWGSQGTGDGQFNGPEGISVDSSTGLVYVTDLANNRIQKFDSNGTFITMWGSQGTGDGQFNYPEGISVDSFTGDVYVTDRDNNRIQKFDSNGTFITMWGSQGTGDGQFNIPRGISVDSSTGLAYVADTDNNRVQVFAPAA